MVSCRSSALLFRERVFNSMNAAVLLVCAGTSSAVGNALSTQTRGLRLTERMWFVVMMSLHCDRAPVKQNSRNSMVHVHKLTPGAPMYILGAKQETVNLMASWWMWQQRFRSSDVDYQDGNEEALASLATDATGRRGGIRHWTTSTALQWKLSSSSHLRYIPTA